MDEAERTLSFRVVDLNYVSLYMEDLDGGVEFFNKLFGPPVYGEGRVYGWRMGATWLTLFSSDAGNCAGSNPRNAEYGFQVERPGEVDVLYRRLLDLGSVVCRVPEDAWMYEPMRFACVDDPFGVRIDIYCPIEEEN